jgi:hypothetical protein
MRDARSSIECCPLTPYGFPICGKAKTGFREDHLSAVLEWVQPDPGAVVEVIAGFLLPWRMLFSMYHLKRIPRAFQRLCDAAVHRAQPPVLGDELDGVRVPVEHLDGLGIARGGGNILHLTGRGVVPVHGGSSFPG